MVVSIMDGEKLRGLAEEFDNTDQSDSLSLPNKWSRWRPRCPGSLVTGETS